MAERKATSGGHLKADIFRNLWARSNEIDSVEESAIEVGSVSRDIYKDNILIM